MKDTYRGRTAVVTGAGSGIGRSLTNELASRGAIVVATDADADAAATTASKHPSSVMSQRLDVTDAAAFADVVAAVVEQHGRIDLVFNNAGIGGTGGEVRVLEAKHWDHIIDVNIRGVINGVTAAYRTMVDQGHGHIVNTASVAGLLPAPALTTYATTKHAVVGLSTSLRCEAAGYGVRVSALCPGALETPILDTQPSPEITDVPGFWMPDLRRYLGRRAGVNDPDDFARYALDRVAKNQAIIVFGRRARLGYRLYRAVPGVVAIGMTRDFEDERRTSGGG